MRNVGKIIDPVEEAKIEHMKAVRNIGTTIYLSWCTAPGIDKCSVLLKPGYSGHANHFEYILYSHWQAMKEAPVLTLGKRFVCFHCSRPGCIHVQGHNCINLIIITLYVFDVEVEEIEGGDHRNPATGDEMILPARKVVVFKCSGKLRDRLNEDR